MLESKIKSDLEYTSTLSRKVEGMIDDIKSGKLSIDQAKEINKGLKNVSSMVISPIIQHQSIQREKLKHRQQELKVRKAELEYKKARFLKS
jgi:FtsZ-binding cell division protein ZapB